MKTAIRGFIFALVGFVAAMAPSIGFATNPHTGSTTIWYEYQGVQHHFTCDLPAGLGYGVYAFDDTPYCAHVTPGGNRPYDHSHFSPWFASNPQDPNTGIYVTRDMVIDSWSTYYSSLVGSNGWWGYPYGAAVDLQKSCFDLALGGPGGLASTAQSVGRYFGDLLAYPANNPAISAVPQEEPASIYVYPPAHAFQIIDATTWLEHNVGTAFQESQSGSGLVVYFYFYDEGIYDSCHQQEYSNVYVWN